MPPKTPLQPTPEQLAAIIAADKATPMQNPSDHAGHGGSYVASEAGELTLAERTRIPTATEQAEANAIAAAEPAAATSAVAADTNNQSKPE